MALILTVIAGILLGHSFVLTAAEIHENPSKIISLASKSMSSQLRLTKHSCSPCVCNIRKDLRIVANCTARHLTSVPNISSVIDVLLMDSNQIVNLTSGCFSKYLNLTELNLAFNMITTIEIGSFQNLRHLMLLNLTGNKLKYTETIYKSNIFKPLQNLKMLTLNNNNNFTTSRETLSYPDKAISDLVSLKQLYLDGLTNQSFGKGFSNLSSLTHLTLAGEDGQCSVQVLFNSTFINVKHIRQLDLSHCDVRYIEPATFSPLKSSLDVLDLSYNRRLRFDNFGVASFGLQNSTLRVLNISGIVETYARCVDITVSNVQFLSNTKIQEIYADDNMIEFIEIGTLKRLPPTLKKVSLNNNRFLFGWYVFEIHCLSGLTELHISGSTEAHHLHFPVSGSDMEVALSRYHKQDGVSHRSCSTAAYNRDNTVTATDVLSVKRMLHNICSQTLSNGTVKCSLPKVCPPPNLQYLNYRFSELWYNVSTIMLGYNRLIHVDFSYNMLSKLYGPVSGVESIIDLNLSNNVVHIVSPTFFQNFISLEVLDLSYNLLGTPLYKDTNGTIFRDLTSLKILNLSLNEIYWLPKNVFQGLLNLQSLDLSKNRLYHAPLYVKHMNNLGTMNFSRNYLRFLPQILRSELDTIVQHHTVTTDLSVNPIACECVNLNFLRWLSNSNITQINKQNYYCLISSGKKTNLSDIKTVVGMIENSCTTYFGLIIGTVSVVLLLLCTFLGGVMYRYRWKLRYWYYGARYHFKRQQANAENGQMHFEFDAFISYADEDRAFVFNEMIEMVESRAGKKLIIHQRDFVPGQPIVSNILESVKKSRKTVLVLSRDFLKSDWCEYEMQMAVYESAHTGRDVLLVLMLENIPCEVLPKEILHLIQSDSYLEYQADENNDLFWQRFVDAIERI